MSIDHGNRHYLAKSSYSRSIIRAGSAVIAAIALLACIGCIAPRVHSSVPAFAHAVDLTATNTASAFQTVEQKHAEVQAMSLVVDYGRKPFNPDDVQDWLAPEDLEVRIRLFEALKEYAAQLAAVAGTDQLQQFDTSAKSLGSALTQLSTAEPLKKMSTGTSIAPNVAATAIASIGRWLIEKKRNKELPDLIKQMQEPVKTVCGLLIQDIGTKQAGSSKGTGLRQQLWIEFDELIRNQDLFISHNATSFTPEQRVIEIGKLPSLVREQRQADQMLAQTQTALQQLVKANDELLRAVTTKQDVHTDIGDLVHEAERIKDFYTSLSSKT